MTQTMSNAELELIYRTGDEGDRNLILHSWIREGYVSTFARTMGVGVWNENHERLLREHVLPRSSVTVACLPDLQDAVMAYAVHEGPALHFVWTKPRWRKLGIARRLLSTLPAIQFATHRVDSGERYPFNPYPLFLGASWPLSLPYPS